MRLHKTFFSLSALLALGACSGSELSSVSVTCDLTALNVGETTRCSAAAKDQDNKNLQVTSTWTSSNPAVATVDASGNVTALSVGAVDIHVKAVAEGVTREGQATIEVKARPPTLHDKPITASETWSVADSPHLVRGSLVVGGSAAPVLTIEEGAEVRFDAEAELRITQGSLRVQGSEGKRVRFISHQATPARGYWRGVVFSGTQKASELDYVTLNGCGHPSGMKACLGVEAQAAPVLRHVTIENSGSSGVVLAGEGSAFGTGSNALSVTGSAEYAVRMAANQADTIPAESTFMDNTPNAVELTGNVSRTQTWRALGQNTHYVIKGDLRVGHSAGCTLTVAAGAELRFMAEQGWYVGEDAPGDLVLDGTSTAQVFLTTASPGTGTEAPAQWRGVYLKAGSSGASRISHTTIEYGGLADNNMAGLNIEGDGKGGGARPLIDHVTVRNSGYYGVLLDKGGAFAPASTHLTVTKSAHEPILIQPDQVHTLPKETALTGNGRDAVLVGFGNVVTTQTWRKLDVPYLISFVTVGAPSKPTLTLEAGTTILSTGGFTVGRTQDAPGILIARGEERNMIRFSSGLEVTGPGNWAGLHFFYAAGSVLYRTRIEYAGADNLRGNGNVNVYREELGSFMTYSEIANSSGCGVSVSDGSYDNTTKVTTVYNKAIYYNSFSNNARGAQCLN